jgi:hypothetical protein
MRALRVGCIIDQGPRSLSVQELLERAEASSLYSVCLLVVQDPPAIGTDGSTASGHGGEKGGGVLSALERWSFKWITRLERLLVARLPGSPRQVRTDSSQAPSTIPRLRVRSLPTGDRPDHRYASNDVRRVREHELDVLVYCAESSAPVGEILDVARLGLITVRYGDPASHGVPPGFWEAYTRNPSTRFRIEGIEAGGNGTAVLYEGAIYTAPFHVLNAERLLRKSAVFAHRLLEFVARNGVLPPVRRQAPSVLIGRSIPSLKHQFRYVARTLGHFLERASRRVMGVRWRWSVAYQFTDDWRTADLSTSQVISNRSGRYFADPFVATRHGMSVCFVEDYDCRSSRARITALRLGSTGYEELGVALAEPFHLSYPFVFEAAGQLYMCPETEQARDIRLYRCTGFPLEWRLHRVLMRGVSAVDTSITFHDGRWWMLTNIDSADMGDYRSELHVFHADTFDSQQWQPHPENPVVFDSSRARNGGLFRFEGGLFRVFQVHGFDVYGRSMGVARIDELSPERYAEEIVATIAPDYLPGIAGTHSMAFDGGVLALDFVRRQRCHR